MRNSIFCAVAVFGAALAASSAAAGNAEPAAPITEAGATSDAPAAKDKPRLVCRKIVQTGTRLRRQKKVCATAEEWEAASGVGANELRGYDGNR